MPGEVDSMFPFEDEATFHTSVCAAVLLSGAFAFVTLVWGIDAPYGRYSTAKGWGPLINAKLAWVLMESPTLWATLILGAVSSGRVAFDVSAPSIDLWASNEPHPALKSLPNLILLTMFNFHYINRSLIFPLRMRGGKPMPLSVMFFAWAFCTVNGYLQVRYLTFLYVYPDEWLYDPRFIVGVAIFLFGWCLNYDADDRLRNLRKPGETGYKIPYGGLFEYVSGANFCGEIIEWTGFAIAGWSIPSITFAIFTFLNTAPRGAAHHKWYLSKFDDYPKNRRAVIPFIW